MGCLCLHLRVLAAVVAVSAVVLALPSSALAARACHSANATPASASKRTMVRATLCVLNVRRANHGLRPLRLNKKLSRAARRHARDMARRNYFDHNSLGGASFVDRIRRAGYLRGARRWFVGENLAWGTQDRSAPRAITDMWMHSPGHRANILSPSFREVGIGLAYDAPVNGRGGVAATYATSFGAKS